MGKRSSAVLEPEEKFVPENEPRPARREPPRPRREMVQDFADDEDTAAFLRAAGKNRRVRRGLIPQSRTGWIVAGIGAAVIFGAIAGVFWGASRLVSRDQRFFINSSEAIEMDGNTHVTRSQLLSVFGEDVDRNIFHVPLTERRAQMEQIPWVEHATVMRLLPNHIRVHVTERTPVAFARQGGSVGMVDANGVLLDIPPDAPGNPNYSFPVVTGIHAEDPLSTRAARMHLYQKFIADLDSDGKRHSAQVSEVDLSDPEDVRALVPDHNSEILAHFGQEKFLARFNRMEEHLPEWRQQYNRLSAVDMRYDRQAVLQMSHEAGNSAQGTGNSVSQAAPAVEPVTSPKPVAAAPKPAPPSAKPFVASLKPAAAKGKVQPPVKKPAVSLVKTSASTAKQAETERKVAAIRAWMAQREKQRAAGASTNAISPASKPAPVAYPASQVK